MIPIAYQPITKQYHAQPLSRSFAVIMLCRLMVILLPLLALISIGYSWPQYFYRTITPLIQYNNHILTCTNGDDQIYEGSYSDLVYTSYKSSVSVGVEENQLLAKGQVSLKNIKGCTLILNLLMTVDNNLYESILPLTFSSPNNISSSVNFGTIQLHSLNPISQSSIPQKKRVGDCRTRSCNPSPTLVDLMSDQVASLPPIIINPRIDSSTLLTTNSSTDSTSFEFHFRIANRLVLFSTSLVQILRVFIPYLIYVMIPLIPLMYLLLSWMFHNRIYSTKQKQCQKVKLE